MVIGNLTGYASQGYGSTRVLANQERLPAKDRVVNQERLPVTLDAELHPTNPNEYSVAPAPSSIPPSERVGDTKSADRQRTGQNSTSQSSSIPQNTDPVSRAFLSIANYAPRPSSIDIHV